MFLQTSKMPWVSMREAVVKDTAIDVFDYTTDWPSTGTVDLKDVVLKDANGVLIAFFLTNDDNEDGSYKLYGRAKMNGPIMLLLEGIVTAGAQVITKHPITQATLTAYWADTITATGGLLSGLVEILDSGNDRIAMLKFDSLIFKDLFMELANDGGSTDSATMYAIICGW